MNYSSNNLPAETPNAYLGGERLFSAAEPAEQHRSYVEQLAPRAETTPHPAQLQSQSIRNLVAQAGVAETQAGFDETQTIKVLTVVGENINALREASISTAPDMNTIAVEQAIHGDNYALAA